MCQCGVGEQRRLYCDAAAAALLLLVMWRLQHVAAAVTQVCLPHDAVSLVMAGVMAGMEATLQHQQSAGGGTLLYVCAHAASTLCVVDVCCW